MKNVKRNILLNPGPATTSDTVKFAQIVPDICPREKEFGDLMAYVSAGLTDFVANTDEYTAVLFACSGTGAVEAMISSVVGNGKILIIDNGAYGLRMCRIAEAYRVDYASFKSSSIAPLDINAIEKIIADDKRLTHLAVVHHETTTGLLTDITAIGAVCKKHNLGYIVDAMSSYAAVPIDMKRMNIQFLASSSNKNIQGMPGVGFVIAEKKALDKLAAHKPNNFYFNLYDQYQNFIKTHQMRFTPPVHSLYALKQAVDELKEEGVKNRYARYSRSWQTLVDGIEKLNLTHYVDKAHHSRIITAIKEPACAKYNFNDMHDFFFSKGITIYPGKLDNIDSFRIANIGAITYKDIETFLGLLKEYLISIGYLK